jgi:hypothetical protein
VKLLSITDGTSNTIMVGEKHVPLNTFGQGYLDSSTYNGDNPVSWGRVVYPIDSGIGLAQSLREPSWKFGSYHTAACLFAFCDGSVRGLPHGIDPNVLTWLGQCNDGQALPDY